MREAPAPDAPTSQILPFNSYVRAERRTEHGWCFVTTASDPAADSGVSPGLVGYVERQHLALDPPEPTAVLHLVQSGEMLKDIASRYYEGDGGFD